MASVAFSHCHSALTSERVRVHFEGAAVGRADLCDKRDVDGCKDGSIDGIGHNFEPMQEHRLVGGTRHIWAVSGIACMQAKVHAGWEGGRGVRIHSTTAYIQK